MEYGASLGLLSVSVYCAPAGGISELFHRWSFSATALSIPKHGSGVSSVLVPKTGLYRGTSVKLYFVTAVFSGLVQTSFVGMAAVLSMLCCEHVHHLCSAEAGEALVKMQIQSLFLGTFLAGSHCCSIL